MQGHLVSEGTRANGTVMMETLALLEAFLDVDRWRQMFPLNIATASVIDVISAGKCGKRNGKIQLMQAVFQVISPMIPVRQVEFVRFCKQHIEDVWAVVDVSVDTNVGGNTWANTRRFPSGCVMHDMRNGCTKVTWVEHMEYDENPIIEVYQPLVRSGMAFGAHKWVTDLQRQCKLISCIMSESSVGNNAGLTPNGIKSIAELAQRMTRCFVGGICGTMHKWEELPMEEEETKYMIRASTGHSGEPAGVILSVTTTIWLSLLPHRLFEFLKNERHRMYWDMLSKDGPNQKLLQIPKSQDVYDNMITLLRGNGPVSDHDLILEDTFTDSYGSYFVRSAINTASTAMVLNGDDTSNVAILPSGFVIVQALFSRWAGRLTVDCWIPDTGKP